MRPKFILTSMVVVLSGCPGQLVVPGVDAGAEQYDAGSTSHSDAGSISTARRANLRFKGELRGPIDLAVGLQLQIDQVCKELGEYQCAGVHTVALGGVDPYGKGLYEGSSVTGSSAPMVVDRIALSGCLKRVDLDLASGSSAIIFKGIPLNGTRLADASGPEVRLALTELAQRAWVRDPTEAELNQFITLNADIEAAGVPEPAKAWMQAACFAAFTSAESVFY